MDASKHSELPNHLLFAQEPPQKIKYEDPFIAIIIRKDLFWGVLKQMDHGCDLVRLY